MIKQNRNKPLTNLKYIDLEKTMKRNQISRRSFLKYVATIAGIAGIYCLTSCGNENEIIDMFLPKKKLLWLYDTGPFGDERIQKELTRKIYEKGLNVEIMFQWYNPALYYDYNPQVEGIEGRTALFPDFEGADIVSLIPNSAVTKLTEFYVELARQGKLFCMADSDSLKGENWLLEAFPEPILEGWKVDGKIYGICNISTNLIPFLVINKKYLGDREERLIGLTKESFFELVGEICEEQQTKGNKEFIGFYPPIFHESSKLERITGSDGLGAYLGEDNKWHVQLLIDDDDYMDTLRQVNAINQNNVYFSLEPMKNNFFSMVQVCYGEENARKVTASTILAEHEVDEKDFLSINVSEWWKYSHHGDGRKTVIWNTSENKELAMKVLEIIYTDKDISNLLMYGVKNENYVTEEGVLVSSYNHRNRIGNIFLSEPTQRDSSDMNELLNEYFAAADTSLYGFHFDQTKMREEWDNITKSFIKHVKFYMGLSDHLEEEEKEIRNELNEACVEKVIDEIEKQLNTFVRVD